MTLASVKGKLLEQAPQRKVGLVVRVSTDRQAMNDEGSLKNQLQKLRQHIEYKSAVAGEDWSEAAVYELKAVSGKDSMRSSEFARLFADIEAGRVNTVACTALDRICRSVKDFLTFFEVLNEHGIQFVCLKQNYDTTTPQGRLFIVIMAALAEFEREQTSERTREATNARSERGLWNGGRILGYDPDPTNKSTLVPNEQEAAVVNTAFSLYLETGSLAGTAEALNRKGYRTKGYRSRREVVHEGHAFRLQDLQRMLKNRAYIAEKVVDKRHGGEQVVPAVWPALVERDTFDAVQRLMQSNGYTNRNGAKDGKHIHVLSQGLLVCGRCGTAMQGRSGTGRQGRRYYYYVCLGKDCGLRVIADEIEGAVIERIGALAQQEDILARVVAQTNRRMAKELPDLKKQQRSLQRQLAEVKASATKLLDGWQDQGEAHGRAFINDRLAELGLRRQELEASLREVDQQVAEATEHQVQADQVRAALQNIHAIYGELHPYERRELVRLVLHKIELHARELVLEINGGVCTAMGETPLGSGSIGGVVRQAPDWLPGLVSQSVSFTHGFPARLPSITRLARAEARLRRQVGDLAGAWRALLASGAVKNRAALARREGVTRAYVTQVLGAIAS